MQPCNRAQDNPNATMHRAQDNRFQAGDRPPLLAAHRTAPCNMPHRCRFAHRVQSVRAGGLVGGGRDLRSRESVGNLLMRCLRRPSACECATCNMQHINMQRYSAQHMARTAAAAAAVASRCARRSSLC
jgi:hypothetical protein